MKQVKKTPIVAKEGKEILVLEYIEEVGSFCCQSLVHKVRGWSGGRSLSELDTGCPDRLGS